MLAFSEHLFVILSHFLSARSRDMQKFGARGEKKTRGGGGGRKRLPLGPDILPKALLSFPPTPHFLHLLTLLRVAFMRLSRSRQETTATQGSGGVRWFAINEQKEDSHLVPLFQWFCPVVDHQTVITVISSVYLGTGVYCAGNESRTKYKLKITKTCLY